MADRSFLNASIPDLVARLRVDEKISLLGAPNWWNTTAIERLHIPAIRMSDGPNGVRGSSHFVPTPAQCLPVRPFYFNAVQGSRLGRSVRLPSPRPLTPT
ncbi:hypothetical protein C0993_005655 [Termitomyces sp. T159_Od127]|nr:hypothetical protein C0993_005655 [Termitomyces sp. T159_Od127]